MNRFIGVPLLIVLLVLGSGVAAAGHIANSTEPAFLHDYGPQHDRADNVWAAVLVALSIVWIGVIIYFAHHDEQREQLATGFLEFEEWLPFTTRRRGSD